MANSYTRTLVETTAAMSLIPKPAGVLAKHRGAVVDPADREAFIDYLSSNFPEGNTPYVAGRTAKTSKK